MLERSFFYSNNAGITSSLYEFILTFSLNDGNGIPTKEQTVFLSPEHAKALLKAFEYQVGAYERAFGEIKSLSTEEIIKLMEQGVLAAGEAAATLEKDKPTND